MSQLTDAILKVVKHHPEALSGEVVNRMHATLLTFRLDMHGRYLRREFTVEAQERAENLRLRHILGDADVLKPWFLHCHEGQETAYGMVEGVGEFGGEEMMTWVREVLASHDPAMVLMMRKGADQHAWRVQGDLSDTTAFPYGYAYPQDLNRGARLAARRLGVSLESLDGDSMAELHRKSDRLWDDAEATVAFKIDYGTIRQKLEQEGRMAASGSPVPEEDDDLDLLDEWEEYVEPGVPEVVDLVSWAGMSWINRRYVDASSRFEYQLDTYTVQQLDDVFSACDVLHYAALGDRSSMRRKGQAEASVMKKLAGRASTIDRYFGSPHSAPTAYMLERALAKAGMTERVRAEMPALADKIKDLAQPYAAWSRRHRPDLVAEPQANLPASAPALSWALGRFRIDPSNSAPSSTGMNSIVITARLTTTSN